MKNNIIKNITAGFIGIFGFMTLFMSTSVIFDLFGIREKEGNFVFLVVLANFFCSFLYLVSSWSILKSKNSAFYLLSVAAIILVAAYAYLFYHINNGGIYEVKTVKAMAFRIILTLIFAFYAYLTINKKNKISI